jgi:hypothetical protein
MEKKERAFQKSLAKGPYFTISPAILGSFAFSSLPISDYRYPFLGALVFLLGDKG